MTEEEFAAKKLEAREQLARDRKTRAEAKTAKSVARIRARGGGASGGSSPVGVLPSATGSGGAVDHGGSEPSLAVTRTNPLALAMGSGTNSTGTSPIASTGRLRQQAALSPVTQPATPVIWGALGAGESVDVEQPAVASLGALSSSVEGSGKSKASGTSRRSWSHVLKVTSIDYNRLVGVSFAWWVE